MRGSTCRHSVTRRRARSRQEVQRPHRQQLCATAAHADFRPAGDRRDRKTCVSGILAKYFIFRDCQLHLRGLHSSFSDLSKNTALKDIILESFNHSNEEVKSAASYALGNISLGNLQAYLPFVLHEIETKPKRQYLLLHSLKEVRYVDLESGIIPLVLSSFLDC